jgi:hypothetical protein
MFARRIGWLILISFGALVPTLTAPPSVETAFAQAGGKYQVGMKVRAKRDCSVQGYQVKKGVVLNVAAVKTDDKGKVGAVDLTLSGMTISNVPAHVMDSLFSRA